MSDELIRKSDVLNLLNDLGLNLINYDIYSQLFNTVDNMPPINAVELPCKVGDTVYKIIVDCGWEGSLMCPFAGGYGCPRCEGRFEGKCKAYIETIQFNLIHLNSIGESIFLTYGEAEKALEELKNE